jgi:hypothetical protein
VIEITIDPATFKRHMKALEVKFRDFRREVFMRGRPIPRNRQERRALQAKLRREGLAVMLACLLLAACVNRDPIPADAVQSGYGDPPASLRHIPTGQTIDLGPMTPQELHERLEREGL